MIERTYSEVGFARSTAGPNPLLLCCSECVAVTTDETTHNNWHDRNDKITQVLSIDTGELVADADGLLAKHFPWLYENDSEGPQS